MVFVDDGSTDNTHDELNNLDDWGSSVMCMTMSANFGAAFCRLSAIKTYTERCMVPDDVVLVFLGMDDELLPNALETIAKHYENGKWMTYGNWIDQHGKGLPADFELDFPDEIHATRDYRKVKYRSTSVNTMYKRLYDLIPIDDNKYNGEWIKATTESHVMFSCLEMCGKDRIGIVKEPIYLYNRREDNARNRMPPGYQDAVYNHVINREKKELLP